MTQTGTEMEFTLGGFDMPVISSTVAAIIKRIASDEIEFFPIEIPGSRRQYSILNVLCRRGCLDEGRSNVVKWTESDGRPEKVGQFRMVINLSIDASRIGGSNIFRIDGWEIALIVSEVVRDQLQDMENIGIVFQQVS